MRRLIFTLAALAVLPAAFTAAHADGLEAKVKAFFERFDKNGDKAVDRKELDDPKLFDRLDVDKDGVITDADFGIGTKGSEAKGSEAKGSEAKGGEPGSGARPGERPGPGQQGGPGTQGPPMGEGPRGQGQGGPGRGQGQGSPLRVLDGNGDGKITAEEWAAAFKKFDTNGDGTLSSEELRAALRPGRPGGRGQGGQGGPSEMGGQRDQGGQGANERVKRMMQHFDKNGDGSLTKDEVPERLPFDRLDTNQDGKLTADELEKLPMRRGGRQGGRRGGFGGGGR